jgi:hypothetical protein
MSNITKEELLQIITRWVEKHDDDELYTVDDNDEYVYIQLREY